jgi:TPP-dependent pyruvate/acetoin dehydrogenase alpha subunit
VYAVREAALELVKGARDGTPAVLECTTYRYMGHSRGDPPHGLYRSDEEIEPWRRRDQAAGLTDEQVGLLDADARARVEEALVAARASPAPVPESALEDVWG